MPISEYTVAEIADPDKGIRVRLPPEEVLVLTQVRGTDFDITQDILPSMLGKTQLFPGVAAGLSQAQARRYLKEWNEIYESNHKLEDLRPIRIGGKTVYVIMVAGHRRRATKMVINNKVARGEIPKPRNFDTRFRVEIRFDMSVQTAIELQFHENRHAVPPPHREATKAWGYYRWLQKRIPGLTVKEFAKRVGRTSEWMRSAMRFCELPFSVQEFVDGKGRYEQKVSYGSLVCIAEISEAFKARKLEIPEEALMFWALSAVGVKTEVFKERVKSYLIEKQKEWEGQISLFENIEPVVEMRNQLRSGIDRHLVQAQWLSNAWIDAMHRVVQGGAFGAENPMDILNHPNAFQAGSSLRVMAARIGQFSILLPHCIELARGKHTGHIHELEQAVPVVQRLADILTTILKEHPQEPDLEDSPPDFFSSAA